MSRLQVTELRCEYMINPLGLDVPSPRLSWVLDSEARGEYQTAYQIIVSESLEDIQMRRDTIVWDSGKIVSTETYNIELKQDSVKLRSRSRYWWRVRVWDSQNEPSEYSSPNFWEMGLQPGDWKAKWISGGRMLKGAFRVPREIRSARLYIVGLGYYEAVINKRKVGNRVLSPAWTDYEKRVCYDTFDVTDLLRTGNNEIVVLLGTGRYPPAREGDSYIAGYGPPKLIAQLEFTLDDGKLEIFGTDESWNVCSSPIISDDLYKGETFDGRLLLASTLDGDSQNKCELAEPPKGRLVSSATLPPIRMVGSILARKIFFVSPGVYTFDFGQNFSGWVKLKVRGPRGARVIMRYAEILDDDGKTINPRTNEKAESTDTYILNGEGVEEYEPRFTYHGFRYVELSGLPVAPSLDTLEGKIVHSDVEASGSFICSNQLLNQIHDVVKWSQTSNLMSIPTDCPQRDERHGWLGDAGVTSEEAIFNYWMPSFYEKWLFDIKDTSLENGSINAVAPAYWKRHNPAEPSWGMTYFAIAYELYLYYGDTRVLEQHYEPMKRYLEYLLSISHQGILEANRLGDYSSPYRMKPTDTPGELISTWVLYVDALTMLKISRILKSDEKDTTLFATTLETVREKFNERFLKERWDRGVDFLKYSYGDSQVANVLPLGVGMVLDDKLDDVIASLVVNISRHHDNHLDTGIIGTKYLFPVLSAFGFEDIAYDMSTRTTYPSYGYMIKEGATTLWERWEYVRSETLSSHNHIMLGSIDAWFYRFLAGINADESNPGFRKIIIRPIPPKGLESASATVHTICGRVSSEWMASEKEFVLKIRIPSNCSASVYVPKISIADQANLKLFEEAGRSNSIIFQDKQPSRDLPVGVKNVREEGRFIVCEVGSGEYEFRLYGS